MKVPRSCELPEERVQLQYFIVIYYMLRDNLSSEDRWQIFSASINAQTDRYTSKAQGQNMSAQQIGGRCKLVPI